MAKRETGASRTKPAGRREQTAAEKSAGAANLAKGRERKKAMEAEAAAAAERGEDPMTAGDRWAMLIDGRLKVADLDDKEVERMKVRNVDGSFSGRGRKLPSHLAAAFAAEQNKRANALWAVNVKKAIQTLVRIATDQDAPESAQIRAAENIIDRALGKSPDVVRIEGTTGWEDMFRDAVGVDLDRDLDAEASEMFDKDADA